MIIDCKFFGNDTDIFEKSKLRNWLNKDFFNFAFSEADKKHILLTENDNGILSSDVYGGTNGDMTGLTNLVRINKIFHNRTKSKDYVYLSCFRDVHNEEYGFSTSSSDSDSRIKNHIDYALASGLTTGKNGKSSWWTRSSCHKDSWYTVTSKGCVSNNNLNTKVIRIAPCIRINGNNFEYTEDNKVFKKNALDMVITSKVTETNPNEKNYASIKSGTKALMFWKISTISRKKSKSIEKTKKKE